DSLDKSLATLKVPDSLDKSLATLKVPDSSGYNIISNSFKKFFTSYTNSFNKVYNKKGSLFQPRYKRLLIEDENQLINTIIYIHNNPLSHGFVKNIADWAYSSYNKISGKNNLTWLKSNEVIELFDDVSNFMFCHKRICELEKIEY
ncbi:MAG: hypothetical protein JW798_02335, partial [Prolixibacteraceae bacterium]|nr:hypothetical protein [Prolixibacteraceae bacterium]MBN2821138.1 hypothetical protein [Bacteroidales bacterium]